jgi:phage shock protein PspC (stress-responsive transcriptional regulator)
MRLERSRTDSRLFGLCGGIARSTGVSSGWVRFGFIAGCFITGGTLFCLYILACMVVPKESATDAYWYAPTPGAYAFGGPAAYGYAAEPAAPASPSSPIDSMMSRLEEQAMNREIQELRAKLARYEQQ